MCLSSARAASATLPRCRARAHITGSLPGWPDCHLVTASHLTSQIGSQLTPSRKLIHFGKLGSSSSGICPFALLQLKQLSETQGSNFIHTFMMVLYKILRVYSQKMISFHGNKIQKILPESRLLACLFVSSLWFKYKYSDTDDHSPNQL